AVRSFTTGRQHVQRSGIPDSVDDLSGGSSLLLAGLDTVDPLGRLVVHSRTALDPDGGDPVHPVQGEPHGTLAGTGVHRLAAGDPAGYRWRYGGAAGAARASGVPGDGGLSGLCLPAAGLATLAGRPDCPLVRWATLRSSARTSGAPGA